MSRPDTRTVSGQPGSGPSTAHVAGMPRSRRPGGHRPRFRCAAPSPSACSPTSTISGRRVVGCLYRRIRVRSRCTTIKTATATGSTCDVIDHVVDIDYFRSVSVEFADRRRDDVIGVSSADSCDSSSPTRDLNQLPVYPIIGCGRRVDVVLRYGAGRLGVAVSGALPVRVRVVREGGEGQRAGLAVGDQIVDVAGRDVRLAKPEVVAALLRSWTGDTLHLTVARPERCDDSGHASSESSSSDDVTSGYTDWLPTSRDQPPPSGMLYALINLTLFLMEMRTCLFNPGIMTAIDRRPLSSHYLCCR